MEFEVSVSIHSEVTIPKALNEKRKFHRTKSLVPLNRNNDLTHLQIKKTYTTMPKDMCYKDEKTPTSPL